MEVSVKEVSKYNTHDLVLDSQACKYSQLLYTELPRRKYAGTSVVENLKT